MMHSPSLMEMESMNCYVDKHETPNSRPLSGKHLGLIFQCKKRRLIMPRNNLSPCYPLQPF